ncbi:MAG TPA: DUF4164 family protein [Caulobacteraceae bacterium]|nr:DUF4164 family protein [Caulobacteraceae bacterium]
MMQDAEAGNAFDSAVRRLERAATLLESRLELLAKEAAAEAGGLLDQDRAKLAQELDAARGRERELMAAGDEAAHALDRAITEIRQVLGSGRIGGEV